MAVHRATGEGFVRGSRQSSKAAAIPAPIKGIDARTILSGADPLHSIYSYNLVPGQYGLKVRPGFREWAVSVVGNVSHGISTLIPFDGGVPESDRLFAVTNEGIWDVTGEAEAPALMVNFLGPDNGGDNSPAAGLGVCTHFVTDANVHLLFYADSRNGLFVYSGSTGAWTRPGITGVAMAAINFVTVHKNQLWLGERETSRAWYLPAGYIAGTAYSFHFGNSFKHGGQLAGLFTWTVDGGEGVDDYFVAVSRAGDVLTYKGTDPSSADAWGMTGQYHIGAVPRGNRFAATQGGALLLLSVHGLISVGDLVQGVDGKNLAADTETQKIAPLIRTQMRDYRDAPGWEVLSLPSLGALLIATPQNNRGGIVQYVMDATTGGWGLWRGVPMLSVTEWGGKVYFGTRDARVAVMDVAVDNARLEPPEEGVNGNPIAFSLLTTFQDYGEPALNKRGKFLRPQLVSSQRPNVTASFRYDYDLNEVLNLESVGLTLESVWNVGAWDSAFWTSLTPLGWHPLRGGWGMGRAIAIATSGNTRAETTLIGWDVIWDSGGPL